jgi:predicted small lipoprotein YifL
MSGVRRLALPGVLLLTAALAACGQKGPLYLPDKKPAAVTPAAPAATPAPATTGPTAPGATTPKKGDPEGDDPPQ